MTCQVLTVFSVCLLCLPTVLCTKLTDITVDVFLGRNNHSFIGAFGDYNADKLVDIFLINDRGQNIDVMCARQDKAFLVHNLIKVGDDRGDITDDDVIVGLVATDFDGDAEMDLLLLTKNKAMTGPVSLTVFWGQLNEATKMPKPGSPETLPWKMLDEPLLFDVNADMHPDLLGELENKTRVVVKYNNNRTFVLENFPTRSQGSEFLPFQSSAFLDLNGDLYPDLWLPTKTGFEVWTSHETQWKYEMTVEFPADITVDKVMQSSSSFADTDQDGVMDHILPVCMNADCSDSRIYIYNKGNWSKAMDGISLTKGETWGFKPPETEGIARYPVTLRIGDYNMDGFPDAIAAVRTKDVNGHWLQKVILLQNVPCDLADATCEGNRKFSPDYPTILWNVQNVSVATFFDINENGILDILVVSQTSGSKPPHTAYPIIQAFRQTSTTDACFVKITVTNGLCYKDCPHGWEPYGVNQPGASVLYETTAVDGKGQTSCAAQLSQSAHFALQPPYAFFGMGMTPNFVDKLTVGVANNKNLTRKREWTQIIPNSQLMVIPYPYIKPDRWKMKLFVTPSRLVLITGAVLIGACGFLAGIIGVLHWRERREDMKEKRQESHKFHFDAM